MRVHPHAWLGSVGYAVVLISIARCAAGGLLGADWFSLGELAPGLLYKLWREANPEETLRFYALRLYEVGMIKTNPNKLIAQGTDWRFLNQLKHELKA